MKDGVVQVSSLVQAGKTKQGEGGAGGGRKPKLDGTKIKKILADWDWNLLKGKRNLPEFTSECPRFCLFYSTLPGFSREFRFGF
ncbi:hypothetical protein E2I00_014163 [Balaenoptera physalus]|uniref:Uncharacterized protein n=1 Tax=Balaenoptera physalus TaxID=9770 RepID=A0A643BLR2_BALPH|nr:hypothetical protein E2I00_014163 [Balaenoptera physalus]